MPSVTFDGQSFSVRGRRIWLSAAECDYALLDPTEWPDRLEALKRLGVNTIVARCPWAMHEERPGRLRFDGALDVRAFAEVCERLDLWLILRIGPAVGGTYDGSGLPAWLADERDMRVREANQAFLAKTIHWYRGLADRVVKLQATETRRGNGTRDVGPVVAVQIEDDWACWAPAKAADYLGELARYALEVGFAVPILTANRSWTHSERAIDVWSGWDDLAASLRQLGHIEPAKPRIAVLRDPRGRHVVGEAPAAADPDGSLLRLARILSAGGQCVLGDAVPALHAGATSGRATVGEGAHGPFAACAASGLLLDQAGRAVAAPSRRALAFASSFGHVLSQLDPAAQPIAVDPESSEVLSVVPLAGPAGRVVFVFSPPTKGGPTLPFLLADGRQLPVALTTRPSSPSASWFLFDADLAGAGKLDFASFTPVWFIERRQIVFVGPAGRASGTVSIDGVPVVMRVPAKGAAKPAVEMLGGISIVLCNEEQIDRAMATPEGIVLHAARLREDGRAEPVAGSKSVVRVDLDGGISTLPTAAAPPSRTVAIELRSTRPTTDLVDGSSPRYATIDGPASLAACGAREGYGWYRLTIRRSAAGTARIHAPFLRDRAQLWLDGKPLGVVGDANGGGGAFGPLDLKLGKGEHRLVMLVESTGRPVAGDHTVRPSGLYGPLFDVKPIAVKPKRVEGDAADPFRLRNFIYGAGEGDAGAGIALAWSLKLAKRAALLVEPGRDALPSVLFVGDAPVARIAADGAEHPGILLDPASMPALAAGRAELRLVFDGEPGDAAVARVAASVRLFEAVPLAAQYAFARWAPNGAARDGAAAPAWIEGSFQWNDEPRALRLELAGAGRGRAFVNGRPVGRYATRDAKGKALPGAHELHVPASLVRRGANEVLLFDELVAAPKGVALRG
jgi:hypothetical protein